jgi:integrase
VPEYRLTRLRGQWAVAVFESGRRTNRYSLGTADRKEAERRLERFQREQSKPEHITVSYLWQRYRDEHPGKRISANMDFSGRAVLPEFGHLAPDEVTTPKVRAYMAKRVKAGRKPGTIWTELNHLQIALNAAAKENLILKAPAIERPTKPPPRDRRLTKAEARRLLDAAEYPHVALAIALMLGTAARIGAILDLTWDRVNFERGLITYADRADTRRRKGRATVPMTDDLRARLEEARRGAESEYVVEWAARKVGSIKRGFARAVKLAELEDVTPHVLRHTAATWMAEGGIPMTEIAAVLGHTDSRTTERIYARFTPGYLRKAVAHLDMSGVPSGSVNPAPVNKEGQ